MATFSRRHYETLADAIRKARERRPGGPSIADAYGIGAVEAEITAMLAVDNPRFDGERFAQASGMRGAK